MTGMEFRSGSLRMESAPSVVPGRLRARRRRARRRRNGRIERARIGLCRSACRVLQYSPPAQPGRAKDAVNTTDLDAWRA